jgi:competence protein ComEC
MSGKIPFLKYTLAFLAGILLTSALPFEANLMALAIILVVLLLFIVWIRKYALPITAEAYSINTLLVLVICGWYYSTAYHKTLFNDYIPETGHYFGAVVEKNPTINNRVRYTVKLQGASKGDSTFALHEKIILFVSDSTTNELLLPGSQISFNARLFPINMNNNPGDFNYRQHMYRKGIRYQGYAHEKTYTFPTERHNVQTVALNLRSKLLKRYHDYGIDNDEFAVLAALTLGEKSYLSADIKHCFSASGAMHVLAVSGLHVGIIFMVISLLLKPMGNGKMARVGRVILIIGFLWGYAFVTGLSPSVLRACTMFSFISVGANLKRRTNIYNTLAVSAFVLMLFNPNIIGETGFQLSYAAVTSIVFFQPRIAGLLKIENSILKYLWELFAVSVAAQIGTFAISIFYFHQFPVYFWLSNYIVIPSAALLLYGAMLFFMFGFVPVFGQVIGFAMNLVVRIMNAGVQWVESLPGSVISNLWIDEITLVLLIILVFMVGWFLIKRQIGLMICLIGLLILIIGNMTVENIKSRNQTLIVFYNNYNDKLVSFIDGNTHYYFTTSDSLNANTLNLLENSSGFFKTTEAQRIAKGFSSNNLTFHGNAILFKYLSISINTQKDDLKTAAFHDIYWEPKKSHIDLKINDMISIKNLQNGKLNTIRKDKNTLTFQTQKDGSLLIFM